MTAQATEILTYMGEDLRLMTTPLEQYLHLAKVSLDLEWPSSALWRGYRGSWEIIDDRLYLTELSGDFKDGSTLILATLFPAFPDRVFAHWYSGTLRIPQGEQLEYVHLGFGSRYERDLLLAVERGVVVQTEVRQNKPVNRDAAPDRSDVFWRTVLSDGS
ncbi:MAG: hypothetical protein Q8N10_00945 [Phenylobacterium sp.]|uniref:hypothetical protein n=1 Tax=Phenylobacterium sp. TaxID=1871053 RepID=UPI0027216810|nr:hypothetical protein [Phenylobacterium sp.]MDO8910693.1 hypothetical protein [Phenylobacterium sp.]MDP3099047.1 hypothetical protein [Phenylobacterium sp.]